MYFGHIYMQVSLEFLFHYRCGNCGLWFSIADILPMIGESTITCPDCRALCAFNGFTINKRQLEILNYLKTNEITVLDAGNQ